MIVDDLVVLLEAAGLGSAEEKTLVADLWPDDPDVLVGVFSSGGLEPERNHSKQSIQGPRVQVRTRALTSLAAAQLAEQAAQLLEGVENQLINGRRYLDISQLQDPFLLLRDGHDRPNYVFNVQIRCEGGI